MDCCDADMTPPHAIRPIYGIEAAMMHPETEYGPCAVESLEGRRLLSGNVSASGGEVLQLRGDGAGNDVRITDNGSTIVVEGRNGTTINGRPAQTFRSGIEKSDIKLFGGNDRLEINRLRTSVDQNIETGPGDDTVVLNGVGAGVNLSVKTDDGSDRVTATNVRTGGDFYAETGQGRSVVDISGTQVGKTLTVIGGDSSDQVAVTGTTTREDLNVEAKKGIDRANLVNVWSNKNIKVDMDAGNDYVRVQNVFAAKDAVFFGEDGFDTFENRGVRAGEKLEIKEFDRFV